MERMTKELRISILKSGGKKALAEFNRKRRTSIVDMNTGVRIHIDKKHKKEKYQQNYLADTFFDFCTNFCYNNNRIISQKLRGEMNDFFSSFSQKF